LSIFSFLKGKKHQKPDIGYITTDVHSHLIPGIDDGIHSIEEGIDILLEMENLCYRRVITSPHTAWGTYDNTPESITNGLIKMRAAIKEKEINIELEAASEYFLDEHFMERLDSNQELLTFGDNYVLIETGFINEPS